MTAEKAYQMQFSSIYIVVKCMKNNCFFLYSTMNENGLKKIVYSLMHMHNCKKSKKNHLNRVDTFFPLTRSHPRYNKSMKDKRKVNVASKSQNANRNAPTILINLYLQNKDVTVKR